jgi:small subunit ribosomal protein S6
MALYENVFIARQEISSAQVDALADQFNTILTENGGAIKKKEYWGLRSLAFRIKKNRKGHYVLLNIDAPAAAVHELERQMRINEDILRFLTIRVDELEEGPSAMMQSRGRDDRPRRFDDRPPRRYDDRGPRGDDRGPRGDDRGPRGDAMQSEAQAGEE